MVHCEHGFTTNLPLADFLDEDCLFAWRHNGQDLEPDHGYPLRLVVPRLYAWKSAKWVRGIELMEGDNARFLGKLGPRRLPHARRPLGGESEEFERTGRDTNSAATRRFPRQIVATCRPLCQTRMQA